MYYSFAHTSLYLLILCYNYQIFILSLIYAKNVLKIVSIATYMISLVKHKKEAVYISASPKSLLNITLLIKRTYTCNKALNPITILAISNHS